MAARILRVDRDFDMSPDTLHIHHYKSGERLEVGSELMPVDLVEPVLADGRCTEIKEAPKPLHDKGK